jgi:hypothetical protein
MRSVCQPAADFVGWLVGSICLTRLVRFPVINEHALLLSGVRVCLCARQPYTQCGRHGGVGQERVPRRDPSPAGWTTKAPRVLLGVSVRRIAHLRDPPASSSSPRAPEPGPPSSRGCRRPVPPPPRPGASHAHPRRRTCGRVSAPRRRQTRVTGERQKRSM